MKVNEISADIAPPRRKGCGCWTVTFVTLLAATTFVVGVYGFWRWSNARGVERMIAIAREKGEPTTPEELAAAYPTSPEIEQATRLWLNAMEQADRSELKDHVNAAIVGYGEPGDEEMRIAMDRFQKERVMSPAIYDASKAYLSRRNEAIEAAHEARQSDAAVRFPLEHEVGWNEYSNAFMQHRHMANVLSLELEVRRYDESAEGSGEILLTLLALAESIRNHPSQTYQFVRFAEQGVAREQLLTALERGDLSISELAALQQAWSDVDLLPALRLMLLDLQVEALHSVSSSPHRFLKSDDRPCPEEDAFYTANLLQRILDRSDDIDAAQSEAEAVGAELDGLLDSPFGERRFAVSRLLVSAAVTDVESLRRYQTWNETTAVVVACERFRREHGDWPDTLDDLWPTYLDEVPIDRFDGGSLKYRPTGDTVAVYSAGEDKIDHGGVITEEYWSSRADLGVRLSLAKRPAEVVEEN